MRSTRQGPLDEAVRGVDRERTPEASCLGVGAAGMTCVAGPEGAPEGAKVGSIVPGRHGPERRLLAVTAMDKTVVRHTHEANSRDRPEPERRRGDPGSNRRSTGQRRAARFTSRSDRHRIGNRGDAPLLATGVGHPDPVVAVDTMFSTLMSSPAGDRDRKGVEHRPANRSLVTRAGAGPAKPLLCARFSSTSTCAAKAFSQRARRVPRRSTVRQASPRRRTHACHCHPDVSSPAP